MGGQEEAQKRVWKSPSAGGPSWYVMLGGPAHGLALLIAVSPGAIVAVLSLPRAPRAPARTPSPHGRPRTSPAMEPSLT